MLDRDKRVRTAERRNIDFADRITLVESAPIAAITDSSTRYEMTATVDCNVWGVAYAVEKLVSIFYAGLYDEDKYYQKTDPHYQAVQDAGGAVKLTRAEARELRNRRRPRRIRCLACRRKSHKKQQKFISPN